MEIGHMPVSQRVYHHILEMIISGALLPGHRLDEQTLSEELGVSRTPLREAIGRLSEKGLVESRPYQGKFVRVLTADEVRDIYHVRRSLEELAIRLATAHMTPERIAHIREVLDQIDEAMKRGDTDAVNIADSQFHDAIAQYSENKTLIETLNDLNQRVAIVRSTANQNPEVVARTAIHRPEILRALETGDADRAAQLLGEHIEFVAEAVVQEKQEDKGEDV